MDNDLLLLAADIRGACALITKITREDLEERLGRSDIPLRALEHAVLRWVQEKQCTLTQLSQSLMISPSSLVPVIDDLEQKKLLQRQVDPTNRRRTLLSLTVTGQQVIENLPPLAIQSVLVQSLLALSEEQRQQLQHLLRLLVGDMSERMDMTGEPYVR